MIEYVAYKLNANLKTKPRKVKLYHTPPTHETNQNQKQQLYEIYGNVDDDTRSHVKG